MSGLLVNWRTFESDMSRYHVLATCQKRPMFLLTPYGSKYISHLCIKSIVGCSSAETLA